MPALVSFRARYRALAAIPGALRMVALSLPMRMSIGTVGLATLLHLRELTGSIAFAASAVGAQLVAMAATAPLLGRLIDRRGPRGVLVATGIASPLAAGTMLAAGPLGLSQPAILAVAVAVGATTPPLASLIRTLWRMRIADPALRRTAFAVDAVIVELAFTIGPLLIALAVATGPPSRALALALVFVAAAVPILFASGMLAWWSAPDEGERHLLGPLRNSRLLQLFSASFMLAMTFGAIEVGYPSFGRATGIDAWGPVLLAVCSLGSAVGGLVFGGLHLASSHARQFALAMVFLAIGMAVHLPISSPWTLAFAAFAAGVLIAPALTLVSVLVSDLAPSQYATEAFTWSGTAIVTGLGAGTALAGALIERFGVASAFVAAVASALGGAALASALARRG